MAKPLKGTRTEKNLLTAFAGESQARNRYTFFASQARKEGYEQIAGIFTETADNEKEHAKRYYRLLVEGLKEENRELIAEIRRLKGDPQYLESVARKELGLVRENEVVYRFKKDSDVSGEGSDQKDKNSQK